jgi:hypothetical protein
MAGSEKLCFFWHILTTVLCVMMLSETIEVVHRKLQKWVIQRAPEVTRVKIPTTQPTTTIRGDLQKYGHNFLLNELGYLGVSYLYYLLAYMMRRPKPC